jgi:hypothetical protein
MSAVFLPIKTTVALTRLAMLGGTGNANDASRCGATGQLQEATAQQV